MHHDQLARLREQSVLAKAYSTSHGGGGGGSGGSRRRPQARWNAISMIVKSRDTLDQEQVAKGESVVFFQKKTIFH